MVTGDGHQSIINPELDPNSKQRSHQMIEAPLHQLINRSQNRRHVLSSQLSQDPRLWSAISGHGFTPRHMMDDKRGRYCVPEQAGSRSSGSLSPKVSKRPGKGFGLLVGGERTPMWCQSGIPRLREALLQPNRQTPSNFLMTAIE